MSTILVNTLTGTSTAGSIAVTGEGNSTTTNLQQGLAKAWANVDRSAGSSRDSFNISGLTDNGTGDFTQAFTNSFANDDYVTGAVTGEAGSGAAATYMQASSYWATGSHRWQSWYYQSTKYDDVYAQNTYTGDLA
jgi:hypothetical protein